MEPDENDIQTTLSSEDIQSMVETDKMNRMNQCWNEIQPILKKYRCQLKPVVIISDSNIISEVQISAM